jgi:hypothetical protein
MPAGQCAPAAQVAIFLGIVCSVVMGVSRQAGDLIMGLISLLVQLVAMDPGGEMNPLRQHIHNQIPTSINTALSNLKLDGQVTVYAICPACHFSHKPVMDRKSGRSVYPNRCSNRPVSDGSICNEPLLIYNDDPNVKKPIKPFVYHHFSDYLAGLLSQHESVMDKACDDCMNSLQDPPPTLVNGFFDAQFIRDFRGPKSDKLFIERPGSEGRYLFTLNLNFFNAEGRRVSGAITSCGLLSMACLNLPLEIRYLPENMYLTVIPGPSEPHLVEINHYLRPLIDDMVISWERGFHISKTPTFPDGRNTRSAIAVQSAHVTISQLVVPLITKIGDLGIVLKCGRMQRHGVMPMGVTGPRNFKRTVFVGLNYGACHTGTRQDNLSLIQCIVYSLGSPSIMFAICYNYHRRRL